MGDDVAAQMRREVEDLLTLLTDSLKESGNSVRLPEGGSMRLTIEQDGPETVVIVLEALRSTDAYGNPIVTGFNSRRGVPAEYSKDELASVIREIGLPAYRGQ